MYCRAMDANIDLPAYFTRIGYTGPSEPSFAMLRELNARHVAHIDFDLSILSLVVPWISILRRFGQNWFTLGAAVTARNITRFFMMY